MTLFLPTVLHPSTVSTPHWTVISANFTTAPKPPVSYATCSLQLYCRLLERCQSIRFTDFVYYFLRQSIRCAEPDWPCSALRSVNHVVYAWWVVFGDIIIGADAITGYCVGYRPDRQAGQLVLTIALQLHVQSGEHLAGGRAVPRLRR